MAKTSFDGGISGGFISDDQACNYIESSREEKMIEKAGMIIRWLVHPILGQLTLIQGINGEFVALKAN